jgi:hypothetical protein
LKNNDLVMARVALLTLAAKAYSALVVSSNNSSTVTRRGIILISIA